MSRFAPQVGADDLVADTAAVAAVVDEIVTGAGMDDAAVDVVTDEEIAAVSRQVQTQRNRLNFHKSAASTPR